MSGDGLINWPRHIGNRPTTPSRKRGFLDLPLELREEIYGHLLLTRHTQRHYGLGYSRYDIDVAVLGVNRQVHDEAQNVFHRNRFVCIRTTWIDFEDDIIIPGKFPLLAKGPKAESFCQPHLTVGIDFCGNTNTISTKTKVY